MLPQGRVTLEHGQSKAVLQRTLRELGDIKAAFDCAGIIAITDGMGKIIYANEKFCEVSKYSIEELIGQDHRVLNSGHHSKEFFKALWKTVASGNVWKGEIRNRAQDGSFYWLDTTIVPFMNEKGKPYQYVSIRYDITKRKNMEEALESLSQQVIQTQEEERRRIAREIHDDLGQSLVTLKMLIQSCLLSSDAKKPNPLESCEKIVTYLDEIIEKTRLLSSGLSPATIEVLGLSAALKAMVDEFKHKKGFNVRFQRGRLDDLIFQGEVINFYRIIQEALKNAATHGDASEVAIDIKRKKDRLNVEIKDNGKGFLLTQKIEEGDGERQGVGLSTMSERAKLLGGDFDIESSLGEGTKISVSLPVKLRK